MTFHTGDALAYAIASLEHVGQPRGAATGSSMPCGGARRSSACRTRSDLLPRFQPRRPLARDGRP